MKKHVRKINFEIDGKSGIELLSFRSIQKIDLDEAFTAELLYEGNRLHILNDGHYSSEALRRFDEQLRRALASELELHKSIQEDIGLIWNDYLITEGAKESKKKFVFDKVSDETERWVGLRYRLWSNPPANLAFWLYAKDGKFFIELTPEYPWALCEPEPDEVVIPYEEFIKDYRPILILEIPCDVLVRWKRQTAGLMRVVEVNEKRIRTEYFAARHRRRMHRIKRLRNTWKRN